MLPLIMLFPMFATVQADASTAPSPSDREPTPDPLVAFLKRRNTTSDEVCESFKNIQIYPQLPRGHDYPIGKCDQHYISCANGTAIMRTCEGDLVFHPDEWKCVDRTNIFYCPPSTPTQFELKPDFCIITATSIRRGTGVYGYCTLPYFFFCHEGQGAKFPCPEGLYFDSHRKQCYSKELIKRKKCGAKDPADHFCKGKEDGFHGENCKNSFYACLEGSSYEMFCPAGLYYDTKTNNCNNKEEIELCPSQE